MNQVEVAIVGGGIAGLSTAVACHQVGINAHLFEAAPKFGDLGTSLSLWPNAVSCLHDWQLADTLIDKGAVIETTALRHRDGGAMVKQPLAEIYAQVGHPGICIRRSDVIRTLVNALPPGHVHTSSYLQHISPAGDLQKLHFQDETSVTAKHIVAADGIWSPTREFLSDDPPPKYCCYGAWLGLSTGTGFPPGEGCEYMGETDRFGVFETGRDTRYWFYVSRADQMSRHAGSAPISEVQNMIGDWPQQFQNLVATTDESSLINVSFFDRPVANHWGGPNVTLIGDAMHPYLPNLGQGACQAIEDAHAIAEGLSRGYFGPKLQEWMQQTRTKRARYFYETSRRVGRIAQPANAFMRAMRPLFYNQSMSWLMRREFKRQFSRPAYPTP